MKSTVIPVFHLSMPNCYNYVSNGRLPNYVDDFYMTTILRWYMVSLWPWKTSVYITLYQKLRQNHDGNQTVPPLLKAQSFTFNFSKQSWPIDTYFFPFEFFISSFLLLWVMFLFCGLPVYCSLDRYLAYQFYDPTSSHTITINSVSLAFTKAAGLLLICSVCAVTDFRQWKALLCFLLSMHFPFIHGLESEEEMDTGLPWVWYNVHTDGTSVLSRASNAMPFKHGDVVNTTWQCLDSASEW